MSSPSEVRPLIREDLVITGEAVALQLPPAPLPLRVLSSFVDVLVTVLLLLVLVMAGTRLFGAGNDAQQAVATVLLVATATLLAPVTIETLTRGRSLGKKITGLRVVRADGGPVRLRHTLARALTGVIEIWFTAGSVALVCGIVDRRSRRLGDLLAGTYAIRERTGPTRSVDVHVPASLSAWARHARAERLPTALSASARGFLERTSSIAPDVRDVHAHRIAEALLGYVSPAPPPGTSAEHLIRAVLAVRRDVELELGQREAERDRHEIAALHVLPHGVGHRADAGTSPTTSPPGPAAAPIRSVQ